jgi:hypothetical protein
MSYRCGFFEKKWFFDIVTTCTVYTHTHFLERITTVFLRRNRIKNQLGQSCNSVTKCRNFTSRWTFVLVNFMEVVIVLFSRVKKILLRTKSNRIRYIYYFIYMTIVCLIYFKIMHACQRNVSEGCIQKNKGYSKKYQWPGNEDFF